jgi:hypothetical protein
MIAEAAERSRQCERTMAGKGGKFAVTGRLQPWPLGGRELRRATPGMIDYFAILTKALKDASDGSPQTRAETYELARRALQQELRRSGLDPAGGQARRERAALEQAIVRAEMLVARSDDTHAALSRLRQKQRQRGTPCELGAMPGSTGGMSSGGEIVILPPPIEVTRVDDFLPDRHRRRRETEAVEVQSVALAQLTTPVTSHRQTPSSFGRRTLSVIGETSRMAIAALLAVSIYALAIEQETKAPKATGPTLETALSRSAGFAGPIVNGAPAPPAANAASPLPSVYGVYAQQDAQLIELKPVPTTPFDPRAQSVLQVSQPSTTRFSNGRLRFVIYRRDLIASAPETVPVRVLAALKRVMKFDVAGTVSISPQRDTWIIRQNGYDFRVQPVPEDREMILVRAEEAQFSLPPGRYALILNGHAYDFIVDGAVKDPAHCVESAPSARGPVFYDCPGTDKAL